MQVESAVALKLLSGGCSLDMSKVMFSSNFVWIIGTRVKGHYLVQG